MNYQLRITIFLFVLVAFASCNNDLAPECFTAKGDDITYVIETEAFSSIHVSPGIELVITQGPEQEVTIVTGENIKQYLSADVNNGELWLENANNCNWVHTYKTTTVYVTTPNLEKIYSASQFAVKSGGMLAFPNLSLQSGIFSETASGTFELEVDCAALTIDDNQSAYYEITGSVENLTVKFYSGDARFDGSNLEVKNLQVFHRSSNDIIAKVQQQVTGTLYSTGNLVLKNHPPVVDVERLYSGRVVYD
ncbi:head GIN domain-containing protein [uncultured Flavobacterium sp.]|uniref:head GIN domain-containing protein n=1 Tax=uncultured Flavobacterium sp. TaxID=165435 RepID=UPI0025CF89F8|nr:head GIN domain-containing protein [uncultured Flavobacterium sp.]